MRHRYEQYYQKYIYEKPPTFWAKKEKVMETLHFTDFSSKKTIGAGGMPVISSGKTAYIDSDDLHTVMYGLSGSKKTLSFFLPLIYSLAMSSENMLINDPKGEIYERMSGFLKAQGYSVFCLNFRTFKGDGFNILEYPAKLYRAGYHDKAEQMITDLVSVLADKQRQNTKDIFWPDQAAQWQNANGIMMLAGYPEEAINVLNWTDYNNRDSAERLEQIFCLLNEGTAEVKSIKECVASAENTRRSILVTASSLLAPLKRNNEMLAMLSHSTFDLKDLCKEKTALFIITDDTTTSCNEAVGIIISQIQAFLINEAYKMPGKKLKTRFNFVLDEFQSFYVPEMEAALATHRSRSIRYYLCVQSLAGLKMRYPEPDALLANCGNIYFLGSTEQELLEKISDLCGETNITFSGNMKPLISPSQLSSLKKTWSSKQALYISPLKSIRFCTEFPSIEAYNIGNYPEYERTFDHSSPVSYTVREFTEDVKKASMLVARRDLDPKTDDLTAVARMIKPSIAMFLKNKLYAGN